MAIHASTMKENAGTFLSLYIFIYYLYKFIYVRRDNNPPGKLIMFKPAGSSDDKKISALLFFQDARKLSRMECYVLIGVNSEETESRRRYKKNGLAIIEWAGRSQDS